MQKLAIVIGQIGGGVVAGPDVISAGSAWWERMYAGMHILRSQEGDSHSIGPVELLAGRSSCGLLVLRSHRQSFSGRYEQPYEPQHEDNRKDTTLLL
jgi:hypothetical protein